MLSEFQSKAPAAHLVQSMAESGFRMAVVDTNNSTSFEPWIRAMNRGFHEPELDEAGMKADRTSKGDRRVTGVWECESSATDEPVGTVSSWPTKLTVSPGRVTSVWAVSSVTVSPTHRRRGIARALLEGELATASDLGIPVAVLTVSESTIYGRFGFAPAVFAADLTIESSRIAWRGDVPEGRMSFLPLTEARDVISELRDSSFTVVPGQLAMSSSWAASTTGTDGKDADKAKSLRAVQYEGIDGTVHGVAVYRVSGGESDFTKHVLDVEYLLTSTPEAYETLWRFLLGVDLVSAVKAPLRSIDEPLRWQLTDQRAIAERRVDHLWVRILDVQAALEAREYSADGCIGFRVSDVLGYAAGDFLLTVRDGAASVESVDETFPDRIPVVSLSVNELSALYLGGVPAATLESAGRLIGSTAQAASAVDAVFRARVVPWLDTWF